MNDDRQGNLFPLPTLDEVLEHPGRELEDSPCVSADDAEPAHEAAEELNASGRRHLMVSRVLERLKQGEATGPELTAITHRFGARIHDLREHYGCRIITTNAGRGVFKYRLVPPDEWPLG